MRQGPTARGYTIVEVIVVMSVTAALLLSAMILIAGQQNKTQFTQSINDVNSKIQDVLNDVTTGYYANTNNFYCDGVGSTVNLHSGTNNQGTNKDCIFIGRAMQFTQSSNYNVFDIVGLRQVATGGVNREVSKISETKPKAIAPSGTEPSLPDATDHANLQYGLKPYNMVYKSGGVANYIGAVIFMSSFGSYNNSGNLVSGAQAVNLIPLTTTRIWSTPDQIADAVNALNDAAVVNPDGGVTICFDSGGTKQYGLITIGSHNRKLTTDLVIQQGDCSTWVP